MGGGWLFLKSRDICSSPRSPRPKWSSYRPHRPHRPKWLSPRPHRPKWSSPWPHRPKCSSPQPPRPKCSSPRSVTETRFMINIYRVGIQMSMLRSTILWMVQFYN